MRGTELLGALLAAGAFGGAQGSSILKREAEAALADAAIAVKRGLPNAPNGYIPSEVDCPSTRPSIRLADTLSDNEATWLKTRRQNILDPMKDLLGRLNITGLDTSNYIDSHSSNMSNIPNIGIACSGGGWRALLNGAGGLAAFDSRTPNATDAGHLGGLLQSATYLSGLSGGSWLVGSIMMNNFSTVPDLLNNNAVDSASGFLWGFQESILQGPPAGGILSNLVDTADYFKTIYDQVNDKEDANYTTTITDYWGRALSFQMINATDGGPSYTFSSLADQSIITQGNVPLPIIVADGRAPGEIIISLNATNYEFTPWEMGSYDPTVFGFVPLQYVGSNFSGGKLPDSEKCISGFDSASYVMGTSSSLFNQIVLNLNTVTGVPSMLIDAFTKILTRLGNDGEDIADWSPNPFFGWRNGSNPGAGNQSLTLVDGGEDLQNIPLTPLVQPVRAVDVIFAIDSSADTLEGGANWPNGTAIIATYERSLGDIANGTSFPAVPGQNSFINLGLNNKPTFFGCDSSNTSSMTPLIVYLPNAPYVYQSNYSTFTLDFTKDQQYAIVENGYDVVTMGNGTRDEGWGTCVGCAILQRSMERTGTKVPDVCQKCFDTYCWNGTTAGEDPATPYEPAYILTGSQVVNGTAGSGGKKSAAGALNVPTVMVLSAAGMFALMLM